jgi:periplasmic protein TonB
MAQALSLRTYRFHVGKLDPTRIAAESGAIAVHGLALLLLLAPLSTHVPERATPNTVVDFIQAVKVPPNPPRPPEQVPIRQRVVPTTPAVIPEKIELQLPPVVEPQPGDTFVEPKLLADASIGRSNVVTEPLSGAHLEYESAPAPSYPIEAIRKALTGTVTLRVLVDVDGKPIDVQVERSSGHRVLDAAAKRQVLAKWRFRPAIQDGQAVQAIGMVPVVFSLGQ